MSTAAATECAIEQSDKSDTRRPVVVNLATGIEENPERVMLAMFAAESALASGKRTLLFVSLEAVLTMYPGALEGEIPCEGCPSLDKLFKQLTRAGIEIYVCPMCLRARHLDSDELVDAAVPAGTAQMMEWIGEQDATVFSF
ncbi:MAG: DsrE family protein [Solirubrobacterales bacterium]|nr:DsrE family protein [Solirubrobacterales bacterium]